MRALTDSQKASFTSDVLTIVSLLQVYANDGTVINLTDHDQDLGSYVSQYGLDVSAILMQLGGTGQTGTATMLPDKGTGNGVTYPMIEGGLLDAALVKLFWADYTKSPLDPIQIFEGYISEATYGDSALVELTLNSKLSIPRTLCGDAMSQTCRADFGDSTCKIDITELVDGPHAYAPIDSMSFVMTRDEITPMGYYNNGTIQFQTGANKGLGYEILSVSAADSNGRETIYTKVPMAFDVAAGDYFFLYPGCDKVITSGCTYWNNTVNFQGEPFIADQSDILPASTDSTVTTTGVDTGLPDLCNWWLTQYIKIGFGVTLLFDAGTRAEDNASTNNGVSTFYDTPISSDAYTAIYNLLGGSTVVAYFDGSLTPVDTTALANLRAAGYKIPLNLTASAVAVPMPSDTAVEIAYAPVFFQAGSNLALAVYAQLGITPETLSSTTVGT